MYYGVPYVDPLYKVSGFTNDGGVTWFSRTRSKKVPDTSKSLIIQKTQISLQQTIGTKKKRAQAGKQNN